MRVGRGVRVKHEGVVVLYAGKSNGHYQRGVVVV